MTHRRLFGAAGVFALLAAWHPSDAIAADPVVLKVGNVSPATSHHVVHVLKPWLARVQKASNGTLEFSEFWGGALIRAQNKQYEGVINGIQDGSVIMPAVTQSLFPQMGLFALPFMFEGVGARTASIVGWKLYEKGMFTGVSKVHMVAFIGLDNAGIHLNHAIKSYDELQGLKIRTAGPVDAETIKALGATPVAIGIPQVAEAMNRGVVDGALSAWGAALQFRFLPIVKSHLDMPLGTRCLFMAFNKDAYEKLPAPAKKAIDDNSGLDFSIEYGTFMEKDAEEVHQTAIKKMGHNLVTYTKAQFQEMKARVKPIHEHWIESTPNGRKVYDTAQQILASMARSN